jgi:hypothetical protein
MYHFRELSHNFGSHFQDEFCIPDNDEISPTHIGDFTQAMNNAKLQVLTESSSGSALKRRATRGFVRKQTAAVSEPKKRRKRIRVIDTDSSDEN